MRCKPIWSFFLSNKTSELFPLLDASLFHACLLQQEVCLQPRYKRAYAIALHKVIV